MNEEKILHLAEQLGESLAQAEPTVKLKAAREALKKEPQVSELLEQYHQQVRKMAELEQQQEPVELDDKHKLQQLEDKLLGSEAFKKFTAAQVDYVDLLRKVNAAIRRPLGEPESLDS